MATSQTDPGALDRGATSSPVLLKLATGDRRFIDEIADGRLARLVLLGRVEHGVRADAELATDIETAAPARARTILGEVVRAEARRRHAELSHCLELEERYQSQYARAVRNTGRDRGTALIDHADRHFTRAYQKATIALATSILDGRLTAHVIKAYLNGGRWPVESGIASPWLEGRHDMLDAIRSHTARELSIEAEHEKHGGGTQVWLSSSGDAEVELTDDRELALTTVVAAYDELRSCLAAGMREQVQRVMELALEGLTSAQIATCLAAEGYGDVRENTIDVIYRRQVAPRGLAAVLSRKDDGFAERVALLDELRGRRSAA